jgi:hypothetical protein
VDSPGTSPDSSPSISRHNSLENSFSFSDIADTTAMSFSSNFASSPSNNEKRTITPGSQLSSSSVIQRRKDDATIKTLKRQLRDAQNVVKVVLGVDEVDKKACIKAAQQVSSMQSEMTKLRDDYKAARDEQEELERRMEMINGESTNGNKGRNMGANGFDKNEYFLNPTKSTLSQNWQRRKSCLMYGRPI